MSSMWRDACDFFNSVKDSPGLIDSIYEGLADRDVDTRRRCARMVRAVTQIQERVGAGLARLKSCESDVAKRFVEMAVECTEIKSGIVGTGACDLTRLEGLVVRVDLTTDHTESFRFKQHYWAQLVLPAFEFIHFFDRATQFGFRSPEELQVVFEQDEKAFETLIRCR